MELRHVPIILLTAAVGCSSAPLQLDCRACTEVTETDAPSNDATNPTVVLTALDLPTNDAICEHPVSVQLTNGDVRSKQAFEHVCQRERVGADGCAGDRLVNTFDERGRLVRTEYTVLDPNVPPETYATPTSYIATFAYDDRDRLVHQTHDSNADGTIEDSTTFTHDDRDRIVLRVRTTGAGTVEYRFTYDDEDRVIEERTSSDGHVWLRTKRFDEEGRLRDERSVDDGVLAFHHEFHFDALGRPTAERRWRAERTETTEWTYGSDGVNHRVWQRWSRDQLMIEERHELTLWPNGKVQTEVYTQHSGDRITQRRTKRYDSEGRELSSHHDDGDDGTINWWRTYSYDDEGRKLTERAERGLVNILDKTHRYEHGGRIVTHVDRLKERAQRIEHDGEGRVLGAQNRTLDGVLVQSVAHTYDANGHDVRTETDRDGDGTTDSIREVRYDDAGRQLLARRDVHADGQWDVVARSIYDAAGQLLYESMDIDGDGEPETQKLMSYGCQRP